MVADQGELAEGYEPSDDAHDGLDRTVSYTLTGWFLLAPTYGRHIAFEHPAVYRGTAHVATSPNEESPNNGKSEGTSAIHWFDVGTNVALKDVWFRSSDINLVTNSTSTKASSGTVSTRERNSMLRLISALATMAKLPEKAPAKSIEKQLEPRANLFSWLWCRPFRLSLP